MRRSADLQADRSGESTWWHDAVFYQVYVRSFADSNSDGVGDLEGARTRLGYLELLGVDAVQLSPFYPSPMAGLGYDMTDPRDVDPLFGDLELFDQLVEDAGEHGLRVVIDLVPKQAAELERTLRFWLAHGVAGFRLDTAGDPRFDDDQVHEIHRTIRRVLDQFPGTVAIGDLRVANYLRPNELHLAANSRLLDSEFDADLVRIAIDRSLAAVAPTGAVATWALSTHDAVRHLSRYGGGGFGDQRARAMILVELALPGAVFLYYGEELGLPHEGRSGLEGARVPLPWEGRTPPFGFTEAADSWLPMPLEWAPLTVEAQLEDQFSMLSLYRQAIELRGTHPAFDGAELEWYGAPSGCFAFRRKGGGLTCALNTSGALVPLPLGEVLLASGPLTDDYHLPPDTAVWMV